MSAQPSLTVDPEFSALCPQQSPEEMNLLEASLEADGCRDPLVIWKGHGILLDGHTRHAFCKRFKIDFRTTEIELADRHAAIEWIIANQLGRRNLSEEQKAYLRGKRYKAEKKDEGGRKGRDLSGGQNAHPKTAAKLATEYGVDEKTIRRDAHFATAVDAIAQVAPEAKAEILSGKSGATKQDVIALASLPAKERKAAIVANASSIKQAAATVKPKPKPLAVSRIAWDRLKECAERIDSIIEQAGGTIGAMFDHPGWKDEDTYFVVEMLDELGKCFTQLAKEARQHAKGKKAKK